MGGTLFCSPTSLSQSQSVIRFNLSVPLTAVSGQQAKKNKPKPNNQPVLAPFVLHCGLPLTAQHTHAHILCKRHTHHSPPTLSPLRLRLRLRCGAVAAVAAPASAPATYLLLLPFSCACTPTCTCLPAPAPAPNFSRLFLDCVPPFPTWLPKSTFTLSRRPHYQMVRFLLSPPSLFSCRDVDEEEDWPPDTDRTLTPAPATTQPQSPERNRRPPVPLR